MREDSSRCEELLVKLGIKSTFVKHITNDLHADYYGYSPDYHVIVEYKQSISDLQKGVIQLFNYYDTLKRSNMYKGWERKGVTRILLYLFYEGINFRSFERYHSLYRDYIYSPNNPPIKFCYYDEENKLTVLRNE